MKSVVKSIYIIVSTLFLLYLIIPAPSFPQPLPGSLQSEEPADTESELRRAYFTNYERAKLLDYYQNEFSKSSFLNIPLLTYRLNYPPEEAQTLIRDQTMSSYLQEIVHPFRESLFINGFIPQTQKDTIIIGGKHWEEKIIVKYVQSKVFARLLLGIGVMATGWFLIVVWDKLFGRLYKNLSNTKWIFR